MIHLPLVTILLAAAAAAVQAAPERIKIAKDSSGNFQFNWSARGENGKRYKTQITQVVFRLTKPNEKRPRQRTVTIPLSKKLTYGRKRIPVKKVLANVPTGDWDVQVAIVDVDGRRSEFSKVTRRSKLRITRGC